MAADVEGSMSRTTHLSFGADHRLLTPRDPDISFLDEAFEDRSLSLGKPLGKGIAALLDQVVADSPGDSELSRATRSLLVSDPECDHHWVVTCWLTVTESWEAQISVTEVTGAIRADRMRYWSHFNHELRNLGFAALSLLEGGLDGLLAKTDAAQNDELSLSKEERAELLHHVRGLLNRVADIGSLVDRYEPAPPSLDHKRR